MAPDDGTTSTTLMDPLVTAPPPSRPSWRKPTIMRRLRPCTGCHLLSSGGARVIDPRGLVPDEREQPGPDPGRADMRAGTMASTVAPETREPR